MTAMVTPRSVMTEITAGCLSPRVSPCSGVVMRAPYRWVGHVYTARHVYTRGTRLCTQVINGNMELCPGGE